MPLFGNRHFSLTMPGLPTGGPQGTGQIVYNDEMVSGELGQIGTQFDGLGHIGTRVDGEDIFYNGFKLSEFGDTYGLTKLGVEKVGAIFTRGVRDRLPGQSYRNQVGCGKWEALPTSLAYPRRKPNL